MYIYIYLYIYNPQKINIYALKINGWKMKYSFFKSVIFRFYLFVLEGEMVVVVLSIWLGMGHPRKSKNHGLPIGRIGNPCSMDHPKDHSTCLVHRTSREFVTFGYFWMFFFSSVEFRYCWWTYALGSRLASHELYKVCPVWAERHTREIHRHPLGKCIMSCAELGLRIRHQTSSIIDCYYDTLHVIYIYRFLVYICFKNMLNISIYQIINLHLITAWYSFRFHSDGCRWFNLIQGTLWKGLYINISLYHTISLETTNLNFQPWIACPDYKISQPLMFFRAGVFRKVSSWLFLKVLTITVSKQKVSRLSSVQYEKSVSDRYLDCFLSWLCRW